MTRKRDKEYKIPIICTGCYEPVDRDALKKATKSDRTFVHSCGKVLYWGENAEVSPISNHDDLSSIDTIKRSKPPAGDA